MTNVCRPVSKSVNCSNPITARCILLSSNVSGHVKRLYQCKPVKAACSRNVSKQKVYNVSSASKLVKPLTASKPVHSTIASKANICNESVVNQRVKPLNVSKSMNSCNVRNRNVRIVNSISQHYYLPKVNKPVICKSSNISVCKIINNRQVFNPVRESAVVNHGRCASKRFFNVRNHKAWCYKVT